MPWKIRLKMRPGNPLSPKLSLSGRTLTVTAPVTPAGAGALQLPAINLAGEAVRSTVAANSLVLPRNCATKAEAEHTKTTNNKPNNTKHPQHNTTKQTDNDIASIWSWVTRIVVVPR